MENTNIEQKNENKKLIIICATIVLVVIAALAIVLILKNDSSKSEFTMQGNISGLQMTYEDFTFGMKDDLSAEVEEKVKSLYDDFVAASEQNDGEAISKVFEELNKLDVYDDNFIGNMGGAGFIEMTPEELAELDTDGDGVIVFQSDMITDGLPGGN